MYVDAAVEKENEGEVNDEYHKQVCDMLIRQRKENWRLRKAIEWVCNGMIRAGRVDIAKKIEGIAYGKTTT